MWDTFKDVFSNAIQSGQAIMKDDDCLFLKRNGLLEETYFTWAITPLVGADGSGSYSLSKSLCLRTP
jgi:hypothetical protein